MLKPVYQLINICDAADQQKKFHKDIVTHAKMLNGLGNFAFSTIILLKPTVDILMEFGNKNMFEYQKL